LCFRSDYSNATDLHIAVTTSGGDIVEFDRFGLRRHRRDDNPPEWRQSLMVGDVPEPWHDFWDEVLEQVSAESGILKIIGWLDMLQDKKTGIHWHLFHEIIFNNRFLKHSRKRINWLP